MWQETSWRRLTCVLLENSLEASLQILNELIMGPSWSQVFTEKK